MKRISLSIIVLVVLAAMAHPSSASACAACFGKSDSPLAAGMNWGIFSLLVVISSVLGTVASFFIFLAKKASAADAAVVASQAANSEKV